MWSKIIPADKVNKQLARKFARHGLIPSLDEIEILESPYLA